MNDTQVTPAEKIEVIPEISRLEYSENACGVITASVNILGKEFSVSPRFDIPRMSYYTYETEEKLEEFIAKNLIIYEDEPMKKISGLFNVNFLKSKDNKFLNFVKDFFKNIEERKKKERVLNLTSNWNNNIFVRNQDLIKTYGGKLNFETLEEYIEKCSLNNFSYGTGICAVFTMTIDEKKYEATISANSHCKKADMVDISGYGISSLYRCRPMKLENAIKKVKETFDSHRNYVIQSNKTLDIQSTKIAKVQKIFTDNGLIFRIIDTYDAKKHYSLFKEHSTFVLMVGMWIDVSETDEIGYFTLDSIKDEYKGNDYSWYAKRFNVNDLIKLYQAMESVFVAQ